MPSTRVDLRNVAGTGAALGWVGARTLVVDRPEGVAGGTGLGFNGGELLAFAIGGCFCNDLRYAADALGVTVGDIAVSVTLDIGGDPSRIRSTEMRVTCDGAEAAIAHARRASTIANSLIAGIPVTILSD